MLNTSDQKVFGWYADFDGCGYYRIIKPLEALREAVLDPQLWETKADRITPADLHDYDVIVGQRICQSDGEGGGAADTWAQKICKDQSILSVYELDDDLLNVEEDNPAFPFFSDPPTQQNIKACAALADLVTVSTEPLREQMLKYNPNVKVLPNFIDQDVLDIPRPAKREEVVIGWCGSGTHSEDFKTMGEELGIVMGLNRNTRFMTIGADYSHGLPIDRVRRISWLRSPRRIYKHVSQFDIGIAPLKSTRFNESKSYIKALEYAALGIPCVASKVGPYIDFIEHGVTGFLVDRPGEWKEYVGLLANDRDLRERMGEAARDKAQDFTIQGNIWRWADAYRG